MENMNKLLAEIEIEIEYTDNDDQEERNLQLYKHSAKFMMPKYKLIGTIMETELKRSGSNYIKVIFFKKD